MKRKFAKCVNCKEETIHSFQKRTGNGKLKREVDRCDKCGYTIIKNRVRTYFKDGHNELGEKR